MAQPSKSPPNLAASLSQGQVGGTHYSSVSISPWEVQLSLGVDVFVNGRICDAIKYLMRDKTDRLEDLKKAIHVLQAGVAVLEAEVLEVVDTPTKS